MPAELFRSVAVRRSSSGRRLGGVPLSIAIHVTVLVAAVTIPLLATDVLPAPQVPVVLKVPPMPVIVVPTPPPPRGALRAMAQPLAPEPGAPLVPPTGITDSNFAVRPTVPDVPIGDLTGLVGGINVEDDIAFLPPPPPPAPKPQAPIRVSKTQMPRKLHTQAPVYPATAIAARIEGTVVIEAIISTTGAVQDARVVGSVPLLDQAALDAVRQWVFTPTLLNGVPVPIILTVNVEFKLR